MSKPLFTCRRTMTAWLAMVALFVLDWHTHEPCGGFIVTIVLCVCGANASEAVLTSRKEPP